MKQWLAALREINRLETFFVSEAQSRSREFRPNPAVIFFYCNPPPVASMTLLQQIRSTRSTVQAFL